MISICLFGVTAGLEVRRMNLVEGINLRYEDSWIEISSRDYRFDGDAEVFKVARRQVADHCCTWIGVYRPATEIHLNRSGGYYGAGVWLVDAVLPGRLARDLAVSLADQLRKAAISGGRFVRAIADLSLNDFHLPTDAGSILKECSRLPKYGGLSPASKTQALISDLKNITSVLDWAQRSRTAEFFGAVSIVSAERVLPPEELLSRKTRVFSSIPAVIEHVYGEHVTRTEQLEAAHAHEIQEQHSRERQYQEQLRSMQSQVHRLTLENRQLSDQLNRLTPKRLVKGNRPIVPARGQSAFRSLLDALISWRVLAALIALIIIVLLVVLYLNLGKGDSVQQSPASELNSTLEAPMATEPQSGSTPEIERVPSDIDGDAVVEKE